MHAHVHLRDTRSFTPTLILPHQESLQNPSIVELQEGHEEIEGHGGVWRGKGRGAMNEGLMEGHNLRENLCAVKGRRAKGRDGRHNSSDWVELMREE